MKKILLMVGFFLLTTIVIIANEFPKAPKFGKVSIDELQMNECAFDSSATAVVLFDYGESEIKYNTHTNQFELEMRRHLRVKILNKEAFGYADVFIPIFISGNQKESVTKIKAATYNLEKGKVKTDKVSRKDIFLERIDENHELKKFTFPKVKEGSVIEYSYILVSPFIYNLESWDFQSSIPTQLSAFKVTIPEYFGYNHKLTGYEEVRHSKSSRTDEFLFIDTSNETSLMGKKSPTERYTVKYNANIYSFWGENIPGLRNEAFVDNPINYLSRVGFELMWIQYPGSKREDYANRWDDVNKDLLENRNFGGELSGVRFMREELEGVVGSINDPADRVWVVFNHIKNSIKWNERYRLLTEKGIRNAYREGSGNSAEINLCLVAALREIGLDAYPIVLSTRSNGYVQPWEVTLSKFNHVIVGVYLNEKLTLLDATSIYSVPNVLPLECLNGQGRLVDRSKSVWVDLNSESLSTEVTMASFTLGEAGNVNGNVTIKSKGHKAIYYYGLLSDDENYTSYKKSLTSSFNNGIVDSIQEVRSLEKSPEHAISFWAKIPGSYMSASDFVYLTPGVGFARSSNPFVSAERKLPINFHYPYEEIIVLKYKIPEGYEVYELPENMVNRGAEGKVMFVYSAAQLSDEIVVNIRTRIGQTLFTPDYYDELKEFFNILSAKNSEKIILKKI